MLSLIFKIRLLLTLWQRPPIRAVFKVLVFRLVLLVIWLVIFFLVAMVPLLSLSLVLFVNLAAVLMAVVQVEENEHRQRRDAVKRRPGVGGSSLSTVSLDVTVLSDTRFLRHYFRR